MRILGADGQDDYGKGKTYDFGEATIETRGWRITDACRMGAP